MTQYRVVLRRWKEQGETKARSWEFKDKAVAEKKCKMQEELSLDNIRLGLYSRVTVSIFERPFYLMNWRANYECQMDKGDV